MSRKTDCSRRRFLAGAALTAVSAGLAGCAGQTNKLVYGIDTTTVGNETRAIVTGTYGRTGGFLNGGKAAYVKLRVNVSPANSEETLTDTTELFLQPPGTEADFHTELTTDNISEQQIQNGDVTVEVVEVKSKVTFGSGAD